MSTSTYRYLGPHGFMVVHGHEMTIGSEAELDDDFIARVNQRGKFHFEPVVVANTDEE